MKFLITQGHQPPANPQGITVVIDVIRAFTTCFHAFRQGAVCIWPVATAEEAFYRREQHHPQALLAGEIKALPIPGFDFGNSPAEVSRIDLVQRELILRTTNGVAATLAARNSHRVLAAALVNAHATANIIAASGCEQVLLVASHPTGDEDMACAEYIRGLLGGPGITQEEAILRTADAFAAKKFRDGSHPQLKPEDIVLAARCETDDFAMEVNYDDWACIRPVADDS